MCWWCENQPFSGNFWTKHSQHIIMKWLKCNMIFASSIFHLLFLFYLTYFFSVSFSRLSMLFAFAQNYLIFFSSFSVYFLNYFFLLVWFYKAMNTNSKSFTEKKSTVLWTQSKIKHFACWKFHDDLMLQILLMLIYIWIEKKYITFLFIEIFIAFPMVYYAAGKKIQINSHIFF